MAQKPKLLCLLPGEQQCLYISVDLERPTNDSYQFYFGTFGQKMPEQWILNCTFLRDGGSVRADTAQGYLVIRGAMGETHSATLTQGDRVIDLKQVYLWPNKYTIIHDEDGVTITSNMPP